MRRQKKYSKVFRSWPIFLLFLYLGTTLCTNRTAYKREGHYARRSEDELQTRSSEETGTCVDINDVATPLQRPPNYVNNRRKCINLCKNDGHALAALIGEVCSCGDQEGPSEGSDCYKDDDCESMNDYDNNCVQRTMDTVHVCSFTTGIRGGTNVFLCFATSNPIF